MSKTKIIGTTSYKPGMLKSTVTYGLSQQLAQHSKRLGREAKVLIIDTDVKNTYMNYKIKSNDKFITHKKTDLNILYNMLKHFVLEDEIDYSMIYNYSPKDNSNIMIDVISTGTDYKQQDLYSYYTRVNFEKFLLEIRDSEKYDYIIIDTHSDKNSAAIFSIINHVDIEIVCVNNDITALQGTNEYYKTLKDTFDKYNEEYLNDNVYLLGCNLSKWDFAHFVQQIKILKLDEIFNVLPMYIHHEKKFRIKPSKKYYKKIQLLTNHIEDLIDNLDKKKELAEEEKGGAAL